MSHLTRWQDLVLPVGMIASVLVILVPLPPAMMDLLLAGNITIAVIVLLTTIYVKTPLEFSIFPSLLLATTLARLVLNVASTRLILTQAEAHQEYAAGGVIKSFGEFVAGNNSVVGLIIFAIIIVIQFVVITKGATRISEVAARFALDGMPGRQMAIDADLNAGVIDEHEARRRRNEITSQADFYGAMDGASKFVRGDAIAGILITMINILGGLVIGVLQAGMPLAQASSLFTKLTIGDGLVSQVPALLISLAAGILVTRSTQRLNLPHEFVRQLFSHPRSLAMAGSFLGVLVFTNLPKLPLLTIAGSCVGLAVLLRNRHERQEIENTAQAQAAAQQQRTQGDRIEDYLAVDPMEMEIGVGLIRLADPQRGGDLLPRITSVRQAVAGEVGIVLPKVRVRDNMELDERQYRVKIAGNAVAEGVVSPHRLLALVSSSSGEELPGEPIRHPAFSQPGVWIDPADRERAEILGYAVIEPAAVLAAHLKEIVYRHADELLTRDATRQLVDELTKTSPTVVSELVPGQMKLGEVQQILQMLLREGVPIRQLAIILEALGDQATRTKDPVWLTEYVRQRLARTICTRYCDDRNRLLVVTLDQLLEDRIAAAVEHTANGLLVRVPPEVTAELNQQIAAETSRLEQSGRAPVVLVSPEIRPALRVLTAARLPRLVVLSFNEVTREATVESVGMVTDAAPATV